MSVHGVGFVEPSSKELNNLGGQFESFFSIWFKGAGHLLQGNRGPLDVPTLSDLRSMS